MMNSPQFLQQMSGVMSNPAVLDQIIAANPQLAAMGPQVREVFQSDRFRELMCVIHAFLSADRLINRNPF
jgi:ubiquilin